MEIWKKYDETYQASNKGRIKNIKTGNILNGGIESRGYVRVKIHGKCKKLHRIVAEVFLPNPLNLPQINHKDENKQNNFVGTPENNFTDGNLEWCDVKYNINYGTRTERASKKGSETRTGVFNTKSSKPVIQYSLSGDYICEYPSACEIERLYGYDVSYICKCCRGEKNKAYGFVWKYKDVV